MKIERVSDTQVKFILSPEDLKARDIKLAELAYGNEKTQKLFREMMRQASIECGFESENAPLMIEAIPFSPEGITIIVTKVDDIGEIEERFNMLPRKTRKEKPAAHAVKKELRENNNIAIFSFDNLDHATDASARLYSWFSGTSVLFKQQGKFFLFLQNDAAEGADFGDVDAILGEYGQKHISTTIAGQHLAEHGETIVTHPAVAKLAGYYGL